MGHSKLLQRDNNKRQQSNSFLVYGIGNNFILAILERVNKMAEMNFFLFFKFIGFPVVGYTIFINLHTWKADVLFILSGLFVLARLYFFVRKNIQETKSRGLKLRKEEHDVMSELKD